MNTLTPAIEVVDMRKILGEGKLKAYADVKFGDLLIVRGFSILEDKHDRLICAMPKKCGKDGRFFDIVIPVTGEILKAIEAALMEAYEKEWE